MSHGDVGLHEFDLRIEEFDAWNSEFLICLDMFDGFVVVGVAIGNIGPNEFEHGLHIADFFGLEDLFLEIDEEVRSLAAERIDDGKKVLR